MRTKFLLRAIAVAVLLYAPLSGRLSANKTPPAPASPIVRSVYFDTRLPAVIAHRGVAGTEAAAAGLHEGTLAAYEYAAALGVDVLEMDVHLTADGRLAVHHDDLLSRSCAGKNHVSDVTMAQLKSCRGALGYEIPQLSEIFARFPGRRMTIEMKTPRNSLVRRYDGIERVLWNEIRAHYQERYVSVSSINATSVKNFRQLQIGVPTGLSAPEQVSFMVCYLARLPRWACAGVPRENNHLLETPYLHKDLTLLGMTFPIFSLVTDSFVTQTRRYDYRLNYWTVNDAPDIRRVFAVHADGIITDSPALALEIRDVR